MEINDLLGEMLERQASDLHLSVGAPPVVRIDGELEALDRPTLDAQQTTALIYSLLSQDQRQQLENNLEIDFSCSLAGRARFRVNAYFQRASLGAVLRLIPTQIPTLAQLGLPAALHELLSRPRGLVLVTGPTGCGKSTTLAAMIDEINSTRRRHIMTIEDPVEFLHHHKKSLVHQREVGPDTLSFANALRSALRQDPDVILIGEMRDAETMATALTAAETGHLVFATLHTQDAAQTIDRIVDVFPPHQQGQVRSQLAGALQGVCAQQLLPRLGGPGRVAACELLVPTAAVRNLIRQGDTHQLPSAIQTGGQFGMQTMNSALAGLVQQRRIAREVALERTPERAELMRLLDGERAVQRMGPAPRDRLQAALGQAAGAS